MEAYRCILTKRDLRTYTTQPIDRPLLLQILDAGRRSGSARNRQPWEFVAVTERAILERLARCGRFAGHLATAPAAVVIAVRGARDLFDAGRSAQSLMLAAWSLGVTSCPVSLHDDRTARAILGLPDGQVVATAIAFGYPDPRGRGAIERLALSVLTGRGRKPLDSLVHWNRYGSRGA